MEPLATAHRLQLGSYYHYVTIAKCMVLSQGCATSIYTSETHSLLHYLLLVEWIKLKFDGMEF